MALSNKTTVEVRQVANGYVVMPASFESRGTVVSDDERLVFQTFAELVAWMGKHFTHLAHGLAVDGA
jgi:hypothetical protein